MTFEAALKKSARYPFGDEHHALDICARGSLRRSDFGMTYRVDNDWVGDQIEIVLGFEAIRQE